MGVRILLVDDSSAVGHQLARIARESGRFEIVAHARNGAEAVKLYATSRPDVVLMDIVMPVMDGLQALRAILGLDAMAKVVMLSSVGGVGEKASEALRLGAREVLSKPFLAEDVLAAIDRVTQEER